MNDSQMNLLCTGTCSNRTNEGCCKSNEQTINDSNNSNNNNNNGNNNNKEEKQQESSIALFDMLLLQSSSSNKNTVIFLRCFYISLLPPLITLLITSVQGILVFCSLYLVTYTFYIIIDRYYPRYIINLFFNLKKKKSNEM
jgi:hypothetical protein